MDKAQADAHMAKHKLHYKDINSAATKAYPKQFDRSEWPPAKNLPDSRSPPAGYGAHVAETNPGWCGTQAEVLALIKGTANPVVWKGTQAEVLALIKQGGGGSKSGVCHNCNKPGQWLRECTKPRREWGHTGTVDAPKTKAVGGKTFNWCAKCGRWTTTHDTSTHTGGVTSEKPEANLGLIESKTAWDDCNDPSAWHVNLDDPFWFGKVWTILVPYIKLLNFGLLFHCSPIIFAFLVGILNVIAPFCWISVLIVTLWLPVSLFTDYFCMYRWNSPRTF
jgi:hypothetical protein